MTNEQAFGPISVVLLPSGDLGRKLYNAATDWVANNLLSTAFWVHPEELDYSITPPKVKTKILSNEGRGSFSEESGNLFDLLGKKSFNPIRVITLTAFMDGDGLDPIQDRASRELSLYLNRAVPRASEVLQMINLITAPSLHSGASPKILREREFSATIIASPEDHATPSDTDTFVYSSEERKYLGFVLLHLGAAAGLFPGIDYGTFEWTYQKSSAKSQIYVSRVFVSGVLLQGISGKTIDRVLEQVADPNSGFVGASNTPVNGMSPIPRDEFEVWYQRLLDKIMDLRDGELRFKVPEGYASPGPLETGLVYSAAHFLRFAWDKLVSLPISIIRYVFVYLIMAWNKKLYDNDKGKIIVKIPNYKFDLRDRQLLEAREQSIRIMNRAKAETQKPVALTDYKFPAELWSDIRELVFGMLDGSNLEKFSVKPSSTDRVMIFQKASDFLSDGAKQEVLSRSIKMEEESLGLLSQELAQGEEKENQLLSELEALDTYAPVSESERQVKSD